MKLAAAAKAGFLAFPILLLMILFSGALAFPIPPAFAGEETFVRIESPSNGRGAESAGMVIRASGVGLEPAGRSGAQARLMARRAAIVDGYRKLGAMRGRVLGSFTGKTYHESASDFIRGAAVVETRYYYDGRVEVDMELPVAPGEVGGRATAERIRETLVRSGITVVEVEPERRRITREEWEELFRKRQSQEPALEESRPEESGKEGTQAD